MKLTMPMLGIAESAVEFIVASYRLRGLEHAIEMARACFPQISDEVATKVATQAIKPVYTRDGNSIESWVVQQLGAESGELRHEQTQHQ